MKKIITLLYCIFAVFQLSAQTTRALFIGNSYTQYNNLPALVANLAAADGKNLIVDSYTPGGYTFQQHSTDATTISKINSQQWDFVILQEQSQRPSFPPAQVASQVYPYAAELDSLIRLNNPCSETVFYMTWGRKNGDASNCANYPPICTYDGMQARLRESYMEMGQDNDATVSPVGAAWKLVRTWNPSFDLYVPDESHPSLHGSYLAACVHYATLFHKSPVGNSFISTLSQNDAALLQSAAHAVVMDSIFTWYQYGDIPFASFSYSSNGNTVQFQNHSLNSGTYAWNFGNGNSSVISNPAHNYTAPGTYSVSLAVSNGCKSDTIVQQITTGLSGVSENLKSCIINEYSGILMIDQECSGKVHLVEGFDLLGRSVRVVFSVSDQKTIISVPDDFATGIYTLNIFTEKGTVKIKLVR